MERGYGKSDNRSDDLLLFCMQTKTLVFCHEIRMEAENEDVILGKILDESSYSKMRSI